MKSRSHIIFYFLIASCVFFILNPNSNSSSTINLPPLESNIQIDGILDENEWDTALKLSIMNDSSQILYYIYLQNDKDSLYIAVDILFDTTENNSGGPVNEDQFGFIFDTDNTQQLSENHDDLIGIWGDGYIVHSVVNSSLPNKYMPIADLTPFVIQMTFTTSFNSPIPHWTVESKIDLAIFSTSLFGLACIITDVTIGKIFPYPYTLLSLTNQSGFQSFALAEFSDNSIPYILGGLGIGIAVGIGIIFYLKKKY